jgi:predicted Zn-dependent protease
VLLTLTVLGLGCSKTPVTNRTQYNLIPDSLIRPIGASTYAEMLSGSKIEKESTDAKRLQKVGKRIAKTANQKKYKWRFSLIDDKTINAWCLPGGKIAFYKGILPVLENEAGMAFVTGHEVGHAVAHHGAERLSQQLTVIGGLTALYMYLDDRTKMREDQRGLLVAALGLGAEVGVLLPFSRRHEKEADIIGMMYMARSGYPPEESIEVWSRMREISGNNAMPAFLSTHPSHRKRKDNLRTWMRNAQKRYQRNRREEDSLHPIWRR